jgi:hypothetical protein
MNTEEPFSVSIQTEASPIPSVPAWFGEVALVAHALTRQDILSKISDEVRFARKRFGTFEVIDFVVVLMGYAISGEPTLAAYYERLLPFATPFMACSDAASCLTARRSVAFLRPWTRRVWKRYVACSCRMR